MLAISTMSAGHGAKQSLGTWGTLLRMDLGGRGGSPKQLSCQSMLPIGIGTAPLMPSWVLMA